MFPAEKAWVTHKSADKIKTRIASFSLSGQKTMSTFPNIFLSTFVHLGNEETKFQEPIARKHETSVAAGRSTGV
jgi:hypothetical protein